DIGFRDCRIGDRDLGLFERHVASLKERDALGHPNLLPVSHEGRGQYSRNADCDNSHRDLRPVDRATRGRRAFLMGVLDALKLNLPQISDIPIHLLGGLPWIVFVLMLIAGARMRSNAPRTLVT